jgi:hypothetical protein
MRVSWRAVTARRLARQGLVAPLPDAVSAVTAMVGAHAQVMSAAELAIGLRTEGASVGMVPDALWRHHALVKTFGPRGTVHLVAASELGPWLRALSALPPRTSPIEGVSLSADQTDAVVAAIADALAPVGSARQLTTEELGDEVVARVGAWAGDLVFPAFNGLWARWRQAIATAAYRGALCFGPQRGAKVTYTLPPTAPDAAAPADAGPDDEDAVLWLLRRYLASYGPASPGEFARWLAAPLARVRELFARADLEPVAIAGLGEPGSADADRRWVNAGDTAFPDDPVPGIRLLPYFDPFVVGSHPRELIFPGEARRGMPTGSAGNLPVLLLDGVVGGVWHARRAGRRVAITVESFVRLTRQRSRELDAQVQEVGKLLGAAPELVLGPIPVGPHA